MRAAHGPTSASHLSVCNLERLMARRIGLYSIRKFALEICKFIARYGAVIKAVYPDSSSLHAALDAANAACAVLVEEIDLVRPAGV